MLLKLGKYLAGGAKNGQELYKVENSSEPGMALR